MKTILATLALAIAMAGTAQAANYNSGLPSWAKKAFEKTE